MDCCHLNFYVHFSNKIFKFSNEFAISFSATVVLLDSEQCQIQLGLKAFLLAVGASQNTA